MANPVCRECETWTPRTAVKKESMDAFGKYWIILLSVVALTVMMMLFLALPIPLPGFLREVCNVASYELDVLSLSLALGLFYWDGFTLWSDHSQARGIKPPKEEA